MAESRRGLLKKTLAGAALLAAAGAVPLALRKTKLRATTQALQFFTPAEYSIWAAVAGRILTDSPPQLDVAAKKDLKQLLALFDNALFSFLSGGPPRPFTQMTPAEQDAQLAAWQTSRLAIKRTGYQAMKRLTCALYFSDPATYAAVGYPGPPYELIKSVLESRR